MFALLFFIDTEFKIQKHSKRLIQKLSADLDKRLVGHPCHRLFFDRNSPCDNCPVPRAISFKTTVEGDIMHNSRQDAVLSRHAVVTPIIDDDGDVRRLAVDCLGSDVALSNGGGHLVRRPENRADKKMVLKIAANKPQPQREKKGLEKSAFRELIKRQSRFASRMAHDIKNPLALISTNLDFIERDVRHVCDKNDVNGILDAVDKMKKKVQEIVEILDVANALKVHNWENLAECDLDKLLGRIITLSLLSKPNKNNDIKSRVAKNLPKILTSELYLERALTELLKALLARSGEQGVLYIRLDYRESPEDAFILRIQCTQQHAFQNFDAMLLQFFAQKIERTGPEISFMIAYATILAHKGSLAAIARDKNKVLYVVKLPRVLNHA